MIGCPGTVLVSSRRYVGRPGFGGSESAAPVDGDGDLDVLSDAIADKIVCLLLESCERAHDVSRADQWMRAAEAVAELVPRAVMHPHALSSPGTGATAEFR